VSLQCDGNLSEGFFQWDNSKPLDGSWYTTKLQELVFDHCLNSLDVQPTTEATYGGMHFVFSNVEFSSGVHFNCAGSNGSSCTVDFENCQFKPNGGVPHPPPTLYMYGIVATAVKTITVNTCSFVGCAAALNFTNANSVSLQGVSITKNIIPKVGFVPPFMVSFVNITNLIAGDLELSHMEAYGGIFMSNCVYLLEFSLVSLVSNTFSFPIWAEQSKSYMIFNQITIDSNTGCTALLNVVNNAKVDFNNSQVTNNKNCQSALSVGAGSSLTVVNTKIANNAVQNGGAVAVVNGGNLYGLDSQFQQNTASGEGGAIYALQGTVRLSTVIFSGNVAETGGAGWCAPGQVKYQQSSCTFTNNQSKDGSKPMQC